MAFGAKLQKIRAAFQQGGRGSPGVRFSDVTEIENGIEALVHWL
jgi:hypothetical protein